ncbi:hypothetical protein EXS74_02135, partial [Candidatus Woesearchaeota archaeon]|nr:hypothetical protein [Candidatus Woesearchaeota archaeon]
MYNLGLPVPPGFIVTTFSFKHFIHVTGIDTKIFAILKDLDVDDNDRLQAAEKEIQGLILSTPLPLQIRQVILEAYEHMNIDPSIRGTKAEDLIMQGREPGYVAVRSSATAEDLPEASFAGEMASYLNIKGPKNLLAAVLACWASLYTARAMYYRVKNHFAHEKVFIAVVVQKMVNSDVAGVMFTVNPVTQDPNEILIEASYGLGEAVVSGSITPDEYNVNKKGFVVTKKIIAKKTWMYIRDTEKMTTIKVDVPVARQEEDCLHAQDIKKLAEYAVKLEEHYKKPQDIEFAVEKTRVYITQTRAITTLGKKKESNREEQLVAKKEEKQVIVNAPCEIEIKDAVLLVSGIPSSPGIGKGKVVIVHDVSDLKKVQKGDVLVARMTTPDHVPAMERANAIVTDAGGSTCFSGETLVLTDQGFLTMKDLYLSDQPFFVPSLNRKTLKVEWRPIIAKMKRRASAIVIESSQTGKMKGNTLTLTPDHKMLTYSGRELVSKSIQEVLDAKEMLVIAQKIPSLPENLPFDTKIAYLLGALLTDGSVSLTQRRGKITFVQKEIPEKEEFISTVVSYLSEFSGKQVLVYPKKASSGIIRGRPIQGSSQCNAYTVCSKVAARSILHLQSSLEYLFLRCSDEVLYSFLAGVIDGDGSYNASASRINIYCGKQKLYAPLLLACYR